MYCTLYYLYILMEEENSTRGALKMRSSHAVEDGVGVDARKS